MGKVRYSQGGVSIDMDDRLEAMVRAAADKVLPDAVGRVERATEWVYEGARAGWPVGLRPLTSKQPIRSRDGLGHEVVYDASSNSVTGRVFNTAWWARYVKTWEGLGSGYKSAYVALLRKPMQQAAKQIEDDVLQYAIDAMRGRR